MARLRKWCCYQGIKRPNTRYSKYKEVNFVHSRPPSKVVRFDLGDPKGVFSHVVTLVSKKTVQIRDSAIESARQTSNRLLEKTLGKLGYHYQIRMYPHHVLRENQLASGAGADRMSTGMAHSFGKPIGVAAQVKIGKELIVLQVNEKNLEVARKALKRAAYKLPCACSIVTEQVRAVALVE